MFMERLQKGQTVIGNLILTDNQKINITIGVKIAHC